MIPLSMRFNAKTPGVLYQRSTRDPVTGNVVSWRMGLHKLPDVVERHELKAPEHPASLDADRAAMLATLAPGVVNAASGLRLTTSKADTEKSLTPRKYKGDGTKQLYNTLIANLEQVARDAFWIESSTDVQHNNKEVQGTHRFGYVFRAGEHNYFAQLTVRDYKGDPAGERTAVHTIDGVKIDLIPSTKLAAGHAEASRADPPQGVAEEARTTSQRGESAKPISPRPFPRDGYKVTELLSKYERADGRWYNDLLTRLPTKRAAHITTLMKTEMKQIPAALADPIAVFEQNSGRPLFLLNVRFETGAHVVVPVEFNGERDHTPAIVNVAVTASPKQTNNVPRYSRMRKFAERELYVSRGKFKALLNEVGDEALKKAFGEIVKEPCATSGANSHRGKTTTPKRRIYTEADLNATRKENPGLYQKPTPAETQQAQEDASPLENSIIRGAYDPSANKIYLTQNADLSTFAHEMSHAWKSKYFSSRFFSLYPGRKPPCIIGQI